MFLKSKKRRAIACAGFIAVSEYLLKKRVRRKWAKNWLSHRNDFSHMSLLRELRANDPNDFRNYLRMDENTFNFLLNLVGTHLQKQNTVMREAIPPEERLIATLRFLATGRSYEDLKFSTCIAAQTLGQLIPETCQVIYNVLKENYMTVRNKLLFRNTYETNTNSIIIKYIYQKGTYTHFSTITFLIIVETISSH